MDNQTIIDAASLQLKNYMAINTLLAGTQPPREFSKAATGAMIAQRPVSLFCLAGFPAAAVMPANVAITSSSVANPTLITTATHGLTNGDEISIQGHAGSTPALDGVHIVTVVNATTFTIPVNVSTGGTGGVMSCISPGGTGKAGITGKALTTFPGQIPFPPSGNARLVRFQGQATIAGLLMLCDRLWHNSGISPVKTGEQVFTNSVQIPSRDVDGANTGVGVLAAVEVSANVGAGTPTLTLKYTNQDGVADKVATNINPTVASPIAGVFHPIGLASGDTGIQKAQSLTLSATWTSGTIHVVLYRVLAILGLAALLPNTIDAIQSGLPICWGSTVPFLVFVPSNTTTSLIQGHVLFTKV